MRRPRRLLTLFVLVASSSIARAHDIPNARVDRSIQATLSPGRLTVDYEVSLSELTLTRDLRALIGALPDGDRDAWFQRYGQETAPLNAKGFLVTIDRRPLSLQPRGFDLMVEEHPRYTFHFEAAIPPRGRLKLQDTNFVSSEGASRLAIRGRNGVVLRGDSLSPDVESIEVRPIWLMSDEEERRSKQAELDFESPPLDASGLAQPIPQDSLHPPAPRTRKTARPGGQEPKSQSGPGRGTDRLSRLLDRGSGISLLGLVLIAFGLGAAHAVQPGHGKTLVAATVVAEGGSGFRGVLLALITTATHSGSVLLVALGLWLTRSTRYEAINSALTFSAGFAIAAIGFWRLGRHLGGYGEHDGPAISGSGSIVRLGVAGGLVPCWDAVALIVLAEAVGRLGTGVVLLVAFGLGMAVVLIAVGWTAARCRQLFTTLNRVERAEHWLGVAGSLVLCAMGIYLLSLA